MRRAACAVLSRAVLFRSRRQILEQILDQISRQACCGACRRLCNQACHRTCRQICHRVFRQNGQALSPNVRAFGRQICRGCWRLCCGPARRAAFANVRPRRRGAVHAAGRILRCAVRHGGRRYRDALPVARRVFLFVDPAGGRCAPDARLLVHSVLVHSVPGVHVHAHSHRDASPDACRSRCPCAVAVASASRSCLPQTMTARDAADGRRRASRRNGGRCALLAHLRRHASGSASRVRR